MGDDCKGAERRAVRAPRGQPRMRVDEWDLSEGSKRLNTSKSDVGIDDANLIAALLMRNRELQSPWLISPTRPCASCGATRNLPQGDRPLEEGAPLRGRASHRPTAGEEHLCTTLDLHENGPVGLLLLHVLQDRHLRQRGL